MTAAKRKKHKYEVLLTRRAVHCLVVEGYSSADAIRILHRKLGGKVYTDNVVTSFCVSDAWSDPSDKGDEWFVSPLEESGSNEPELFLWDGHSLKPQNMKSTIGAAFRFLSAKGKA